VNGFAARQVVVAHPAVWDGLVQWGKQRNLELVQIPGSVDDDGVPSLDPGDDLPCYAFMPAGV
jgi:hypothetical protein